MAQPDPIRLYYSPRSRASRVRWMLEEIGLEYDLVPVDIHAEEGQTAAYRAIHPLGQVPALQIDGQVLFESLAICLYLADRHPQANLAPADLGARGAYYQWCAFATGSAEPAVVSVARLRQAGVHDDDPALRSALAHADAVFSVLDGQLQTGPFVLGSSLSTADVLLGQITNWGRNQRAVGPFLALVRWLQRLQRRAGWLRSLDAHD